MQGKIFLAFAAACSLSAAVPGVAAAQSITIDGRLSPAQTLAGPNYAITANLGKQVSSNLFHSFGQFGLASSESATFSGPATVSNVIGRVTGGAQSNIDGKIASTITGASLYLINPSGIVFGPHATVDVSGGFHASTADYLRMSDGAKFQATNPGASTFSAAPPAAFGFLTATPAKITVNGSNLGVPSGQTLGLAGGPVAINGAALSAPAGTIHVTSAAGTGEVPVDPRNTPALTVTSFGPVHIKGGSTLDVSDPNNLGSGGSVFIRSGALTIDASEINGDNYGSGSGGVLSLRGDNQITLSNGASVHAVAMGDGNGADVLLSTASSGAISADASMVLTDSFGPGNSGPITIVAGQLALRNGTNVLAQSSGSGSGGEVIVTVGGALTIDTGASLGTVAFADGKAGNVSVTAAGQITIDMSIGAASSLLGGIGSAALGTGNGGDISVAAGTLTIANSGSVSSVSVGDGNSGSVSVNVSGMLSVNGSSETFPFATGILADAVPGSTGTAGKVTVNAGGLSILSHGEISASALGFGNAGSVSVSVAGGLTIDGAGADPDRLTGISSLADLDSIGNAGAVLVRAGNLSVINFGEISTNNFGSGQGGQVFVTAGVLSVTSNGRIASATLGSGTGGSVFVAVAGQLSLDGAQGDPSRLTGISAQTQGSGDAGTVIVTAGVLSIGGRATIASNTFGSGTGGSVSVMVDGQLAIDGVGAAEAANLKTGIAANSAAGSTGDAGDVFVEAGAVSIVNGGAIASALRPFEDKPASTGNGGSVTVNVAGLLSMGGSGSRIATDTNPGSIGNAGTVAVTAPQIAITSGAEIVSTTAGTGAGGSVMVTTPGALVLDGAGITGTQIAASATGPQSGPGGLVTVRADTLTVAGGAQIASSTAGPGKGGDVTVTVANGVTLSGVGPNGASGISAAALPGSGGQAGEVVLTAGGAIGLSGGAEVTSSTAGAGNGGTVRVTAQGPVTLTDSGSGIVALATSAASGDAGSVTVSAPQIELVTGAEISSTTAGTGMGGSVMVMTPGALALDGAGVAGTQIAASATGPQSGPGGSVTVGADALTVAGGAQIASSTAGPGKGGDIAVTVANGVTLSGSGPNGASGISAAALPGSSGRAGEIFLVAGGGIALSNGAAVTSSTAGIGNGGSVQVMAGGPLNLIGSGTGIIASATATASGDAGSATASAPQMTLSSGAEISSTTAGTGAGGSVVVTTPGILVLDGAGVANTQIAASATGPQSGQGGSVTVGADILTVEGGAQIASSTAGPGKGGDVTVTVGNGVALSGVGPTGASGISAAALPGSSGRAGEVVLTAGGAIGLSGGAEVTSSTAGVGNGGSVQVAAGGPLTLTGSGTGIIASATATASGDAGSVIANAPQITVISGAEISSTTAGTGAGGSVVVTTPGMLALDGAGVANTQIAASATGPRSGSGGSVTVAANSLTIQGGARIASSTAGPGTGGDVNIAVASDILLPDPGPQITARSTGSGDAGSITVSAMRLMMNNGASISTEAETSTANGGNITLHLRDFLYLVSSEISTSVKGETGSGGNIVIDPQLVILNHSSIIAQAIEGHGGNITITADQFIPSSDSIISATSELGISGTIVINGPRVDVNGALVVLSSQLRGRTEVLREACEARAGRPISSLVEAGRGGLPQDPEATLPALYIAGRDLNPNPNPQTAAGAFEPSGNPRHTTARLTMRCG